MWAIGQHLHTLFPLQWCIFPLLCWFWYFTTRRREPSYSTSPFVNTRNGVIVCDRRDQPETSEFQVNKDQLLVRKLPFSAFHVLRLDFCQFPPLHKFFSSRLRVNLSLLAQSFSLFFLTLSLSGNFLLSLPLLLLLLLSDWLSRGS